MLRIPSLILRLNPSANCIFGDEKKDFIKDTLRPPIGTTLFEKRFKVYYNKYKGVKQSLYFLQSDQCPDVEELFEQEWKNIQNDNNQTVLSRHINIQYYLQEVLRNCTERVCQEFFAKNLYAKLADRLQKAYVASKVKKNNRETFQKFAFVSFNQDSILEYFISEYFGKPLEKMDDYVEINNSPYCIFKPHGSHNWGWEFSLENRIGETIPDWLFKNKINYYQLYFKLLRDSENMVDWNSYGHEASLNPNFIGKYTIDKSKIKVFNDLKKDYYPALLLPYRDKDEFTMPLRHFRRMKEYFGYVETLIIIGWKGNEEIFNKQLFKNADKISKVIIADPNHQKVIENIQLLLSKKGITPLIYKDFEDFIEKGLDYVINI